MERRFCDKRMCIHVKHLQGLLYLIWVSSCENVVWREYKSGRKQKQYQQR